VGEQILGSLQASLATGDRQVMVRLDPPELGSVVVRVQEQGDQISGVLEIGRIETRREVEQALPEVLRGLEEAGFQVRRLEVTDQAARDLGREQMSQDAWAQREDADQQEGHPDGPYRSGWSTRNGAQPSAFDQGDSNESPEGVGRGRIDMLV
jgi:flagellar hook-length control protein FliK